MGVALQSSLCRTSVQASIRVNPRFEAASPRATSCHPPNQKHWRGATASCTTPIDTSAFATTACRVAAQAPARKMPRRSSAGRIATGFEEVSRAVANAPSCQADFEHSPLCTLQATAPTGHDRYTDEMAGKQMQSSPGVGDDWLISDKDIADLTKALAAGDVDAAAHAIGVGSQNSWDEQGFAPDRAVSRELIQNAQRRKRPSV